MKGSSVYGKEELNYVQIRKAGNEKWYKQIREEKSIDSIRAEQSRAGKGRKESKRAREQRKVESRGEESKRAE